MKKLWKCITAATLAICVMACGILQTDFAAKTWAAEVNLDDGLVGYWTFEGNTQEEQLANKASDQTIHATITGSGVTLESAAGVDAQAAASFGGNNNSYLTLNLVGANQGLQATSAFTIGLWMKLNAMPGSSDNTSIFHQEGDGNGNGRAILTIGGNGKFGTYLDATNRYGSQTVQRDEWHHVMLAVDAAGDGRKAYFYLDGVKTNEVTLTGSFVNGSGNIRVGAHRVNADNPAINGVMDEIRYYNKVIDADTVKAIYDLHGEAVSIQQERSRLAELIESARELGADGTDEVSVQLKEAIEKAEGILAGESADLAALEAMITELTNAIRAVESQTPVAIEADTSNVIREIPSAMFGINHRYHKYGYGTWDKENHKMNDAFGALVKEAKFGSVRYPGGTVSNLFTWKDTIGDEADRTTTIAGNNFYSNAGEVPVDPAFGVDEAMTWIYDDLNADAIFVYGLGRGTPQDAADLVEYLNAPNDGSNPNGGTDWAAVRAENGHEEPYGVTRFELGNEFSDTGQNYWMSGASQENKGTVDLYIEGDVMTISGQRSYYQTNNRVAKKGDWRANASKSDGNPNEERYVYYLPVVEDSAEVFVAGTKWEIVESLDGAGAANVCTFDYETGKISFGDGTNGNIPQAGQEITCNYKTDQAGFVDYYKAMKAVDPKIELYSGIVDRLQNEFIDKMHQKGFDNKYDGVIIHPYSSGVASYEDSLVKAKNFSNNIATYKNKMHTVSGDDKKKVAVSEFGILSVSPASNYQTSLGHAIYIANHMVDCVNSGAAYQNKHCLVDFASGSDNLGAWQQCVIQCHEGENGNTFVSTPSARLFSIFNEMTGNLQVRETVTGNEVFTGSGASAVNNLNVYTTKDDVGNTYIMVINNKKENASAVELSIKDRDLTGRTVEIWSMGSDNVDDANTLDAPNKVTVEKTTKTADSSSILYTLEPHSVYSFKIQADPVAGTEIAGSDNEEEGTVTGMPQEAMPGDEVTVTATPKEGYVFVGWFLEDDEEPVSTEQEYTFVVIKGKKLTAKFEKKKFKISVTAETGGTASCDVKEAVGGDSVTVTAAPNTGYDFDGWYEGSVQVSKEKIYTFAIQKDTQLTARFLVISTPNPPAGSSSGSSDSTNEVQAPDAPKGVKAKKVKKGIQLSWKKTAGADGYVIYRSYKKNKGYKKLTEIKKAGTKKYLDKKAKKGKTAYYKIKSYKTINGKKVLSAKFSKVVKKKR
ncbi:MAG: hypothetical protein HFI82_07435 [Eubacterium sp.]|jgi:alpha-L-arabinofuranosidase|nr:hypothetical protein [Eubacterium sp.]